MPTSHSRSFSSRPFRTRGFRDSLGILAFMGLGDVLGVFWDIGRCSALFIPRSVSCHGPFLESPALRDTLGMFSGMLRAGFHLLAFGIVYAMVYSVL